MVSVAFFASQCDLYINFSVVLNMVIIDSFEDSSNFFCYKININPIDTSSVIICSFPCTLVGVHFFAMMRNPVTLYHCNGFECNVKTQYRQEKINTLQQRAMGDNHVHDFWTIVHEYIFWFYDVLNLHSAQNHCNYQKLTKIVRSHSLRLHQLFQKLKHLHSLKELIVIAATNWFYYLF